MLTSRVQRHPDDLQRLGGEWDDLLERAGWPTPFLTRTWLLLWWRHYGAGRPLFLVTVRDEEGRLAGGGLFYLGRRRFRRLPWPAWRELRLAGTSEELESDYLGILALPERREEVWREILAALRDLPGGWDLLHLSNVLAGEPEVAGLAGVLRGEPWLGGVEARVMHECPEIRLPGDFEEYLAGLKPKFRQEVRRLRRRLEKRYAVRYRRVGEEGATLEELLPGALAVHRAWAEARGWLSAERLESFHRFLAEAAAEAHRQRWLYLVLLEADGRPAGALFDFFYRGTLFGFQKATDPGHANDSLDNVLLGLSIEDAIRQGAGVYDFMQGGEEYKERWTTRTKRNWVLSARRRSLRGRLHEALGLLRSRVRQEEAEIGEAGGGQDSESGGAGR